MKNHYKLKILLITINILLVICSFSQTGTIRGLVKYKLGNSSEVVPFANIKILNTEIRTTTNYSGAFKIESVPVGTYEIVATYIQIEPVTHKIEVIKDSIVDIQIEFTCCYDKSENNKICPICHKSDKVIPVVYSIEIKSLYDNIIGTKSKIDMFFYSGTDQMSPCHPHWYCKRDKKLF